ncbi:hypothetical protein [Bacillus rhizoplanae]|uniref:hypothetical protein n=1 Tax=Bacillus rhizoplanae TaxID=2880966 RepID=UPI003D255199
MVDGTTGGFNIAKDFVLGKSPVPVDGVMGLRRGTNWEAAVKASHDESKGIIQSRISKLESSGAGEGTSNTVKEVDSKKLLPNEGDIGTYKDLNDAGSVGDDITLHHMPSKEYLVRKLEWDPKKAKNDGMSINVEQPKTGGRHRRTETYGRNMTNEEKEYYYSLEVRDALAFDLGNLRKIYMEDGVYKEIRPSLREYARQAREDYYKKELKKK